MTHALTVVLLLLALAIARPVGAAQNVILILTDDQRADTLAWMPRVRAMAEAGVEFQDSFVTTPLCCPSRASLLTGQYANRHGVLDNKPPHGGAALFDATVTIATVLQKAGYTTAYFGKYLNSYNLVSPAIPPGWGTWQVFVDDLDLYFGYRLNEDGVERRVGDEPSDYSTDLLLERTLRFIRGHAGAPFFVVYAPAAPHGPSTPAPRHVDAFKALPDFRPPSFGKVPFTHPRSFWAILGASWLPGKIALSDELRRHQLESLVAVDEAVGRIRDVLTEVGLRDRTTVIFTSDNGVAWGEHAMLSGHKRCAYDDCLRVPLIIEDPSAARRVDRRHFALNIDLGPTIADVAGVELPNADGASLLPLVRGTARVRHHTPWRRDFLIEGWGYASGDPPTFVGVRSQGWKYVRADDKPAPTEEVYRLRRDPDEAINEVTRVSRTRVERLRARVRELRP
jgi:arylsulfatase A-like enzyme